MFLPYRCRELKEKIMKNRCLCGKITVTIYEDNEEVHLWNLLMTSLLIMTMRLSLKS